MGEIENSKLLFFYTVLASFFAHQLIIFCGGVVRIQCRIQLSNASPHVCAIYFIAATINVVWTCQRWLKEIKCTNKAQVGSLIALST